MRPLALAGRLSAGRRWLSRLVVVATLVLWVVLLRPTWLGGPAGYVVVAGDSMLPTLDDGTLVVTTAGPPYVVGDVVAFAVDVGDPAGRPIVIHRIIAGDQEHGYTTQGDSRPFSDPWTVRSEDIVGRWALVVQGFGHLLLLGRSPIFLASVGAGLAAYIALGWTTKANATGRRTASAGPRSP